MWSSNNNYDGDEDDSDENDDDDVTVSYKCVNKLWSRYYIHLSYNLKKKNKDFG